MRALFSLAVAAMFALGLACSSPSASGSSSGDDAGSTCPTGDLPQSCPSPAPTYAEDIAPIFQAKCNVCHGPGGEAKEKPFTTYDEIKKDRTTCLDEIYGCKMPPAETYVLSADERKALLSWFICDLPK